MCVESSIWIGDPILSVVESSHIGKVWYWEGVYHLLRDTNCFGIGVWVYSLISSPFPHVCVCVYVSQIKKILSVVESSHIGKVWYWEGVYHLVCEYIPLSHPPSPICVCVCVCVSQIKKILSVIESSHIDKVWYWEGVYHLLRESNCFGVGVWVYSLISSPFPHICVCLFLKFKKKKKKIVYL